MNTLNQLIEESYKIFAKYRVSALSVRDFCWCLDKNSAENLLQVAVKDLDTVTITDYIDVLHLDDDDDYFREEMRVLLPRILELLVLGTE